MRATFFEAGHILDSAITVLEIAENGWTIRLAFSASGMAEFGRIRHHLANNIGDPRHTVLLVGFQAEHTLGRKLADGLKRVRIFGEKYTVRAQVERVDRFSAHADRNELLA